MLPFAVNDPLCQANFPISGLLVKVAFLCRFESTRTLERHLLNIADIAKVDAIASDTINPNIAYHQHA